ncbi:MAG: ABC transporter substrate-binding protein [Deltaproteobacteria bacterium]
MEMEIVLKKVIIMAASLVLIGLAGAPGSFAGDTIKVGFVDTYTGPASAFTLDVLDGFKMAIWQVNARGGVLGKKITFVTRDDRFTPDIALAMAKELVFREKVDILAGTLNSGSSLAVSGFALREKIPFIVTYGKSDKISGEKGHRYVFMATDNTQMAGRAAAVALAQKPFLTYWIAGDDYEYGHAIADDLWHQLKKLKPGVRKIGESWWKVETKDFAPYITAILAARPDFIIGATGGFNMVHFQQAAKAAGLTKKIPFYQHTGIELSTLEPQGRNAPAGVYGTANYLFYYPDTSENKAFVQAFRKHYNRSPKAGALYGYAVGLLLEKGYARAGRADTEKLIDALEGLVIESPAGPLEMRACDHQLLLPMFFGVTKKSPLYPFLIAADLVTVSPQDYMMSCRDVMALRK